MRQAVERAGGHGHQHVPFARLVESAPQDVVGAGAEIGGDTVGAQGLGERAEVQLLLGDEAAGVPAST